MPVLGINPCSPVGGNENLILNSLQIGKIHEKLSWPETQNRIHLVLYPVKDLFLIP